MELPQYHIPQAKTVLLHVWERLKGFIIKSWYNPVPCLCSNVVPWWIWIHRMMVDSVW